MSLVYKQFSKFLFLLISLLLLFSPSPAYADLGVADHTGHQHEASSSVNVVQTDCASACINSSRTERQTVNVKESKAKKDKVSEQSTSQNLSINNWLHKEPAPKIHIPDLIHIYKYSCTYIC